MGCGHSKIDNEEAVARSKDRRNLINDAVSARKAFASGHSGYSFALKNIGAALSDFAQGEAEDTQQNLEQSVDPTPGPPPPHPPALDPLPPPPPPLPNFSPSPIKRAVSMPSISKNNKHTLEFDNVTITEDEEEEEEDDGDEDEDENDDVGEEEEVESNIDKHETKNKNKSGGSHGDVASASMSSPRTPEMRPSTAWDYFFLVDDHLAEPSLNPNKDEEEPHISVTASAARMEENVENSNVNVINKNINTNYSNKNNIGSDNIKNVDTFMKNDIGDIYPREPEKVEGKVVIEHASSAPPELGNKRALASVSLMQVLNQIDDHFLKASQSTKDVSYMLEANRLHYHSNFADNRALIDHSARVMQVITWNRSLRGLGVPHAESGVDDFDLEDNETLAIVLDKMLAWEKKLFKEVKRAEVMKFEYQRKVSVLNKLKKRGATNEMLEKAKAAVAHLHTKYVVDMQTMDSSVSEVNRLRDEELYPKLVALVDGMAKMWENMCLHHDSQLRIVSELKPLDVSHAVKETTRHHHERTEELFKIVQGWHTEFEKFVNHQKQFTRALHSWLKLNLIPIESSLKEKVTSPPRTPNPPIQALLHAWHDYLEKLPDEIAKSAISSFAAVIKTIILHQEEEMKLREKCEETRKELLRKNQAYEEWHRKYKKAHSDESEAERVDDATAKDPVLDRQIVVEGLRKRLEEETEAHQRHSLQVREKSLGSLKLRLPDLFRAMSDFSHASLDAHEKLRSIIQAQTSNHGHS